MTVLPLTLGFFLGLQHAFEPDHLAAISSLIAGKTGVRRLTSHGLTWGAGHLLTLSFVGGMLILGKTRLDEELTKGLTLAAGAMLIALGLHVFHRLSREEFRFNARFFSEGHHHESAADEPDRSRRFGFARSLAVGAVHGLEGSGPMAILASATADSTFAGLSFLLLFGMGSMIGMCAMSTLLAVPLTLTAQSFVLGNRFLQIAAGALSFLVGASVVRNVI